MEATFFFIAESTQADDRGNPVNALWRKVGNAAPVELVQGVEDMQLLYGVDSTADDVANVNQYQTIDNVADVNDIVAIQVTLTVSSVDPLTELNNQRMQRTFSKTVHVRNAG
jgi:type IV pilus assembly protein PilW